MVEITCNNSPTGHNFSGAPTYGRLSTLTYDYHCRVTTSALLDLITSTTVESDALQAARRDAAEMGLAVPDTATAAFLTAVAASKATAQGSKAIIVSPAPAVPGLAIAAGFGDKGHFTAIDTEPEHLSAAREAFALAGVPNSRFRALPSRPLEVLTRMTPSDYVLVWADVPPADVLAATEEIIPLLTEGGVLMLPDVLLDGTIADPTRTDRDTASCRAFDEAMQARDDVVYSRLALGAGMAMIIKKPA